MKKKKKEIVRIENEIVISETVVMRVIFHYWIIFIIENINKIKKLKMQGKLRVCWKVLGFYGDDFINFYCHYNKFKQISTKNETLNFF
jgi:hypothetical protein